MSALPEIVIFDVDGTLANVEARVHHIQGLSSNWDAFFDELDKDPPIEPVVALYKKLCQHTDYEVILLTGRAEQYRQKTAEWFQRHGIPFKSLLMRQDNDNRHDHVVKEEILKSLQAEGRKVAFVVEDRNSVVAMWRRNGILCLQCADGDF